MFSVEERDRVRDRLLQLAADDPLVSGAALTGSLAGEDGDAGDRWSDIDLVLGIDTEDGNLGPALAAWTARLYAEFGALHHWDVTSGPTVYRVFLLPDLLEVDLSFSPAAEFGPRGPQWRTVFGTPAPRPPAPDESADENGDGPADGTAGPEADHLVGLAWHHLLHSRVCIERNRLWQAEHWISAVRGHLLALMELQAGHPTACAKGAHLLPRARTAPLEPTLVRTLTRPELARAHRAAANALHEELTRTDPDLAARLAPLFAELSTTAP